jgi:hypothetical protein
VKRDVRDEYVTLEGAARDYGVVIVGDVRHPEQLEADGRTVRSRRSRPPRSSAWPPRRARCCASRSPAS